MKMGGGPLDACWSCCATPLPSRMDQDEVAIAEPEGGDLTVISTFHPTTDVVSHQPCTTSTRPQLTPYHQRTGQ